jgi:hypothetical protein
LDGEVLSKPHAIIIIIIIITTTTTTTTTIIIIIKNCFYRKLWPICRNVLCACFHGKLVNILPYILEVIVNIKVKVKLSMCLTKHHAMKTYWGSGGIAPHILDLGSRWR